MVAYVGLLRVKAEKRDEYIDKLLASGMIEAFRNQEGNLYYQVAKSVTDENIVVVTDGWTDMETFTAHDTCSIVKDTWLPLAGEYVEETKGFVLQK